MLNVFVKINWNAKIKKQTNKQHEEQPNLILL